MAEQFHRELLQTGVGNEVLNLLVFARFLSSLSCLCLSRLNVALLILNLPLITTMDYFFRLWKRLYTLFQVSDGFSGLFFLCVSLLR